MIYSYQASVHAFLLNLILEDWLVDAGWAAVNDATLSPAAA